MNDFRCYIVDSSSHIRFRVEITATDLEAAKRDAYGILRMKREQSLLSMHGIELWRGIDRLYRSAESNKNEGVRIVCGSGKDQSAQAAALNGAAEYVKHRSGSAAFRRGSTVIGQQRSVKEWGRS